MRRWTRAPRALVCGCCNHQVAIDEPICYVKVGHVDRELPRCTECAGPAPPDLPAATRPHEPGDFSMVNVGALKPKTRGAFKALVKEWMSYRETREPGEED